MAVVSGAAPFAFAAVASAEPGAPNPNENGPEHTPTACGAILDHNQAIHLDEAPLGILIFQGVGLTFDCFEN